MQTPLYHLFSVSGNNELFIKRDDLIPHLFGGNKARIAQNYLKDMCDKGCNCMVGYGNARSNLCRALALACSEAHFPCHIISPADDDGTRLTTFNSRIVQKAGAELHLCSKQNVAEAVDQIMTYLHSHSFSPYYIYGNRYGKGNEAVPVSAYVPVYREIVEQADQLPVHFDYIFLPTGVGTTQSGLLTGQSIYHGTETIIGISVARSAEIACSVIADYCSAYSKQYNTPSVSLKNIHVDDQYIGSGYGQADDELKAFIDEMLVLHSLPLDETYTGKAFWGMLHYLERNHITGKKVLFLHTGGTPLFFDHLHG